MWCRHCGYDISGTTHDATVKRCPECGVSYSLDHAWSWHSKLQHDATRIELSVIWCAAVLSFLTSTVPILAWADTWRKVGIMPTKNIPVSGIGEHFGFLSNFFGIIVLFVPVVLAAAHIRRGNAHVKKFQRVWYVLAGLSILFVLISLNYPSHLSILKWWLSHT